MPNSPFIKPCEQCKGARTIETGWLFNRKKQTCGLCGGIGYMPDRDYWENFLSTKLMAGNVKTTAVNLPALESGIVAFKTAMVTFPADINDFFKDITTASRYTLAHRLYYAILGEMYFAKGNILWDMGRTQENQPILFLEAIEL